MMIPWRQRKVAGRGLTIFQDERGDEKEVMAGGGREHTEDVDPVGGDDRVQWNVSGAAASVQTILTAGSGKESRRSTSRTNNPITAYLRHQHRRGGRLAGFQIQHDLFLLKRGRGACYFTSAPVSMWAISPSERSGQGEKQRTGGGGWGERR